MEKNIVKGELYMKVYNKEKTTILTDFDLEKGYLIKDTITRHINAVVGQKEVFHYKTIKEYANGGKDVEKIIDIPEIKAIEEHDETEEILVYIVYTEQELEKIQAQKRIVELKNLLNKTDYQAIKFAEGELSSQEYQPIKELRRSFRLEINQLQTKYEIKE